MWHDMFEGLLNLAGSSNSNTNSASGTSGTRATDAADSSAATGQLARSPRGRHNSTTSELELEEEKLLRNCHFGPALEDEYLVIDTPTSTRTRRETTASQRKISGDEDFEFDLADVHAHPMCERCASALLPEIDARCVTLAADCERYELWFASHAAQQSAAAAASAIVPKAVVTDDDDAGAAAMQAELDALQASIDGLDANNAELMQQKRDLDERLHCVGFAEAELLQQRLDAVLAASSTETRIHNDRVRLAALASGAHAPLRQVFRIELAAAVGGRINGLALQMDVDRDLNGGWHEVNGALGQLALLFTALARRVGLETVEYRVLPYADRSEVHVRRTGHSFMAGLPDEQLMLPLYCFEFGWQAGRFDRALTGLLVSMLELAAELKRSCRPAVFRLPNRQCGHRGVAAGHEGQFMAIGTMGNTAFAWTQTMKLLLQNMEYMRQVVCELPEPNAIEAEEVVEEEEKEKEEEEEEKKEKEKQKMEEESHVVEAEMVPEVPEVKANMDDDDEDVYVEAVEVIDL